MQFPLIFMEDVDVGWCVCARVCVCEFTGKFGQMITFEMCRYARVPESDWSTVEQRGAVPSTLGRVPWATSGPTPLILDQPSWEGTSEPDQPGAMTMNLYRCRGTFSPCRVNITTLVNTSWVPKCQAQFKCRTYVNSFKSPLSAAQRL